MRSKRPTTIGLIAASVVLLAACASGPQVRSNADPQANLSAYRTYGFVEQLGTDRAGYSTIVSEQLKNAVRRELEARGYSYAQANPQLLVNFNARLDDKLRVNSTPSTSIAVGRGYYGYRGGFYSAWPAYDTSVDQYTQGTLNIDVVDAAQKRLVWEGIAVGRVTQKARQNLGKAIDSTVSEIFKQFPATARAAST